MTATADEIEFRALEPTMAAECAALELRTFATIDPSDLYNEEEVLWTAQNFPEGGFVAVDDGRIIGMGLGILKDFDFEHPEHPLDEVYMAHDPNGDWYYGTTIAVDPEYRGRGIGQRLYDLRKGCVQTLNKRGIVAGGVLPGFADHKDEMGVDTYISKVRTGELYDPTLTFQMENGFEPRCALPNYLNDPSVGNNSVLIVWENPDYTP